MVTSIAGVTSPPRTIPYLSNAMFKLHRRRGVSVENLAPKGSQADQEAALTAMIEAGSSWCDDIVGYSLGATYDTQQRQANVDSRGYVTIAPRCWPVLGLTAFSIGPSADQLSELQSLAGVSVEEGLLRVPVFTGAMMTSSEGPIQFGAMAAPYDRALCRWTYVHSYPVTRLTADVAAGATSIQVDDTTGIVAGQTWLTIHAGQARHRFVATSVSTADSGGLGTGPGTVGCSALPAAVVVGDSWDPTMVSGMPAVVIEAVVLAIRGLIKDGGSGVSSAKSGQSNSSKKVAAGDDFAEAEKLLRGHFRLTP